jgi:hypothetical protein
MAALPAEDPQQETDEWSTCVRSCTSPSSAADICCWPPIDLCAPALARCFPHFLGYGEGHSLPSHRIGSIC